MSIEQVALVVVGLAITAISCITVLVAIPYMARLTALYNLHSVRDDLFEMGMNDGYRNTLVYRDLDALLAGAINVLRTGSSKDAVLFFAMMSPSGSQTGWRTQQVKAELNDVFRKPEEREFIVSIGNKIRSAMAFRFAFSSPPFYVFLVAILVKKLISLVAKKSMESLEGAVNIDRFNNQQSVGGREVWRATKKYYAL